MGGGKPGDHLREASIVEHLQSRGGCFHQVPEQVQSLNQSWSDRIFFGAGCVWSPVVWQRGEKDREGGHHILTNQTLSCVRMVGGKVFQSTHRRQPQNRIVFQEERRTRSRHLGCQCNFYKVWVRRMPRKRVAAANFVLNVDRLKLSHHRLHSAGLLAVGQLLLDIK